MPLTSGVTGLNFPVPRTGITVRGHLLPALSFLLPLALYCATTAREIFWLDSAEFVVVTAVNGLAHPPGYPLLLWILKAVALIPLLSLPFRLNLVSALLAAGSCLVLFGLIKRLTADDLAALLGALVWAISWEQWQQATAIEVYSLNTLLVALLLLAGATYAETGSNRSLLLILFLFGLGLAHHLFIIFWVPALVLITISGRYRRPQRSALAAGIPLLLLGPLLYLTLLFRFRDLPSWAGVENISDLPDYVLARVYRYRLLAGGTAYLATQLRDLPGIILRQFSLFWLLLIPGIIALFRQQRRILFGLLTGVLTAAPAALLYNIPDKEGYFLPVWFAAGLVIGCGIHGLRRHKPLPVTLALLLLIAAQTAYLYPRQDRSGLTGLVDLVRAVRAELPGNAVLFTDDYSLFHGINWHNLHARPEDRLTVISQYHLALPWYLKQLGRRLPVPSSARTQAEKLWIGPVRTSDIRFGELARQTADRIMAELVSSLQPESRVFFFPQNFTTLLENWQNWRLRLNGLTYEFVHWSDTLTAPPETLHLPGPDRYRTNRFHDPLTIDLCRRFAATVNRRGMLRYARGDADGALADFNLSLRYYPDYPAAIENKGLIFAFEGPADSARHYLTRFLQLEPDSPERAKVELLLRRLTR